jgi:hypothetical protein
MVKVQKESDLLAQYPQKQSNGYRTNEKYNSFTVITFLWWSFGAAHSAIPALPATTDVATKIFLAFSLNLMAYQSDNS